LEGLSEAKDSIMNEVTPSIGTNCQVIGALVTMGIFNSALYAMLLVLSMGWTITRSSIGALVVVLFCFRLP
jgi:hypothetical protein